jgi:hypothetical protein
MAGQSSQLTLKEACAMQERVQHSGSHALSHGGKKGSKTSSGDSTHMKKQEHQG